MCTGPGRLRRLPTALGATLFPGAPEGRRTLRRGELAIVVASVLAIATFLHLLRLGLSTSLNSFWAEDGTVFFGGALAGESILTPYTNYLVLLPRLIGEAATVVPLEDAPAATSTLAAIAAAGSGLAVWYASSGHIRSPYLRGALAAATVLAPVSGLESTDSGSYASWYMLFATFWLLLWRPRTDWGALLGSLFILLTALSNASVWFLIPIAVLRAIAIRDRRDAMIVAAFALGSVIQVPVALTHGQMAEPTWSADIWTAYAQRVVNGAALGLRLRRHRLARPRLALPRLAPRPGRDRAGDRLQARRPGGARPRDRGDRHLDRDVLRRLLPAGRRLDDRLAVRRLHRRRQPLRDRPGPAAAQRSPRPDRQLAAKAATTRGARRG